MAARAAPAWVPPQTTGTGRDATRAVLLPSLRPKAGSGDALVERGGAEAWPGRPERGGRNPSRLFKALDCTKGFPEEHGRKLAGGWG